MSVVRDGQQRAPTPAHSERTAGEEPGRGEVEEHIEAVDDDEERDPPETPVGKVRLQFAVIHELRAVKTLRAETAVCRKRCKQRTPREPSESHTAS